MTDNLEFLKDAALHPERLFSAENPVFDTAAKAQRGLYETFDSTARASLSLASDLLDLNRRRIEDLYAGKSLSETLQRQTDMLIESGKRFVVWTDEVRDAANAYRAGLSDLVEDVIEEPASARKPGRKTTKAA